MIKALSNQLKRHLRSNLDKAIDRLPHSEGLRKNPWVTEGNAALSMGLSRSAFLRYVEQSSLSWERGIHWDIKALPQKGRAVREQQRCYNLLLLHLERIYGCNHPVYLSAIDRQCQIRYTSPTKFDRFRQKMAALVS